jgi:hypothetical protein
MKDNITKQLMKELRIMINQPNVQKNIKLIVEKLNCFYFDKKEIKIKPAKEN